MAKAVEEKYKSLTDIEHILLRPGMYIGAEFNSAFIVIFSKIFFT